MALARGGLIPMNWIESGVFLKYMARQVRPLSQFDATQVRNLLMVNTTALGDTLLSTPAVRALAELFPKAHRTWMINPRWRAVFAHHPHVHDVLYFDNKTRHLWSLWRQATRRYDLAVILHGNDPQASLAALMFGAHFVVRVPHGDFPMLHSNPVSQDASRDIHGIMKRLLTVEVVAGAIPGCEFRASEYEPRMEVAVDAAAQDELLPHLSTWQLGQGAVYGFQVGASNASRLWPTTHYVALARALLLQRPDARVVLTGGTEDAERCRTIRSEIGDRRVIDACGAVSLAALPALLRRFRVFVTPDTGVMHLAVAVGVPTVTLFAVAHHSGSGALVDHDRHRFVQGGKTCSPCIGKRCEYAVCMSLLTPDEVLGAIADIEEMEPA